MIKTFKYRLKGKRQRSLAAQAVACNQVWNWCVAQHQDAIKRHHSGAKPRQWLTHFSLCKLFHGIGADLGIAQQTVESVCHQWTQGRSLNFRSSFGQRRARGWIPFRQQSRRVDGNSIVYRGQRYRFFGTKRRPLPADVKGGAFVEDAQGRWWVCFHVEIDPPVHRSDGGVGIDLGLKEFATLSDGRTFAPSQSFRAIEGKLSTAQRAGNRRRVRALHDRAANVRRDFHHKLSTSLARDYAFIAVGNVSPKRLAKTRMAKSIHDAGWSAFRNMLRYKAACFVEVDEKFTTQTCSSCGALPPERPKGIAGLGIRSWDCSACGASHDRDVNAALNILKIGRSVTPLVEGSRKRADRPESYGLGSPA